MKINAHNRRKLLLADFAHWINNNWYEPMGSDGMWRKNENSENIPKVNLFNCEDLAIEYLNEQNKYDYVATNNEL